MSGGHFNHRQMFIADIAADIQSLIDNNDNSEPDEWGSRVGHGYSPETMAEFARAVEALRVAYAYAKRIDWLVSADDSEDSFHARLKADLDKIEGDKP
mgnify:CR=1 FL=1